MPELHPHTQLLLQILDQAFDKRSWHGTNLRGSIRGLTPTVAAWRPAKGRHNIWEIVVHAAYWKYIVRRRLLSERRGSFPIKGSNWFPGPMEGTRSEWKATVELLEHTHVSLREAVAHFPVSKLHHPPTSSTWSNIAMIYGIASHDLYHAGQIQLLKRMSKGKRERG
jgi:hypothetical protein